jgi:hypothetical protein
MITNNIYQKKSFFIRKVKKKEARFTPPDMSWDYFLFEFGFEFSNDSSITSMIGVKKSWEATLISFLLLLAIMSPPFFSFLYTKVNNFVYFGAED